MNELLFQDNPELLDLPLDAGIQSFLLGLLVVLLIVFALIYILNGITYSRLAKKAGIKETWLAWIPYGAHILTLKMGGLNLLWFLLFPLSSLLVLIESPLETISSLGIIAVLIYMDKYLLEAFGKNGNLAFLHLIPGIGSLIILVMIISMAFDNSVTYCGPFKDDSIPLNIEKL